MEPVMAVAGRLETRSRVRRNPTVFRSASTTESEHTEGVAAPTSIRMKPTPSVAARPLHRSRDPVVSHSSPPASSETMSFSVVGGPPGEGLM